MEDFQLNLEDFNEEIVLLEGIDFFRIAWTKIKQFFKRIYEAVNNFFIKIINWFRQKFSRNFTFIRKNPELIDKVSKLNGFFFFNHSKIIDPMTKFIMANTFFDKIMSKAENVDFLTIKNKIALGSSVLRFFGKQSNSMIDPNNIKEAAEKATQYNTTREFINNELNNTKSSVINQFSFSSIKDWRRLDDDIIGKLKKDLALAKNFYIKAEKDAVEIIQQNKKLNQDVIQNHIQFIKELTLAFTKRSNIMALAVQDVYEDASKFVQAAVSSAKKQKLV